MATLGFNHFRHLEAYFAVPGMGSVLHTANPRLSPKEIAYILNHAEDKVLLFDPNLLPLVEAIRGELKTVRHLVVMDEKAPEGYLAYEEVLGEEVDPVRVPERAACGMAYTTGTTGLPKGWSTATGPWSSTPWRRASLTAPPSRRRTWSCRWCRCSTSTPGACPTPPPWWGPSRSCPAQAGPRLPGGAL